MTVILPQWLIMLEDLKLDERMMPRDVTTRWNSTYDMLEFAVEYRSALNSITGNRDMKLRQYELSGEEWVIVKHLRDVLKVNFTLFTQYIPLDHSSSRFLKMRPFFFHEVLRTLRRSFQRWITLTPILRRQLDTGSIRMPFKRLSLLERKLSIVTMTRQINPKFSVSLWVCCYLNILSLTTLTQSSASSSTQTRIF